MEPIKKEIKHAQSFNRVVARQQVKGIIRAAKKARHIHHHDHKHHHHHKHDQKGAQALPQPACIPKRDIART